MSDTRFNETKSGDKYFSLFTSDAEIRVFTGASGIPGWTSPGDVQIYIDDEWDERDNWSADELRGYAAALNRAADIADALAEGLPVP